MEKFEDKVRITGIGQSQIGRKLDRNPLGLIIEACINAMKDAGLERKDIDGLSSHPGKMSVDGNSAGGIREVEEVLRIQPVWFTSAHEMSGHTGALVNACLAINAGLCKHVIVYRGTWESTAAMRGIPKASGGVDGDLQWRIPFGAFSAANWISLYASNYFAKYGATREQLGAIALNARANAALNPNAIYRTPLTMDDYLSARMISSPLGLYDCDIPCDGATAIIVSAVDAAKDTRRKDPIRIEALGTQITERYSWDQGGLEHEPLIRGAVKTMWARTDLKPKDVKVAELYDGFTFNCLCWLELMGFCPEGEGARFVEGGKRIARDGELPLNTHGGQLSAGRLQGFGFLHEACVQLWGEGGERQVPNNPNVAAVSTGGGTPGGAILLTRG